MEEEKLELRKVRDFGDLISDSFAFITQNWKPLLKSYFSICGFFLLAAAATAALQQSRVLEAVNPGEIPRDVARNAFGWEWALNVVCLVLSYLFLALTVFSYISLYNEKGKVAPSLEEVWSYVKYFFLRLLGAQILLGLLLIVATIFLVLPGIYLWPIASLILAIMVFENGSLGYSFDRGFRLIKNKWWLTFGAFFVMSVIVYAGTMVFVLPVSFMTGIGIALGKVKFSWPALIFATIVQYLCQVFWIFLYVVISLSYFSLAEEKDGIGLRERISGIGKDDPDSWLPKEEY